MSGRQDWGYDQLRRFVEAESGTGRGLVQSPEDNAICSITYNFHVPCLFVCWKSYATSAQLRFIHETLIHLIMKHRVDRILGDDTALPFISESDQDWIVRNWMPRAIAAGLKRAASKRPDRYFGQTSVGRVQSSAPSDLLLRSFESLDEAKNWLTMPVL
jgi:hypothetical protein